VTDWWAGLDRLERQDFFARAPDLIRNLDGMPASTRNLLNREALQRDVEWWEGHPLGPEPTPILPSLSPYPTPPVFNPDWVAWQDRANRRDDIMALRDAVAAGGDPPRYLLEYQPTSLDQDEPYTLSAIAIGNPDTAANVGVFVGGITTNPRDKMGSYLEQMENLRQKTGLWDEDDQTSTIVWMGYKAPESGVDGHTYLQFRAREGAEDLTYFTQGLAETHQGPLNLTVLGHSYGSCVSGIAAEGPNYGDQVDPKIDNLVLFGSPGMGGPGSKKVVPNLYNGHEKGDNLVAGAAGVTHSLGSDPDNDDEFIQLSTAATAVGRVGHGHSGYLEDGTTFQFNAAAIVAGNPSKIIPKGSSLEIRPTPSPSPGPPPVPPEVSKQIGRISKTQPTAPASSNGVVGAGLLGSDPQVLQAVARDFDGAADQLRASARRLNQLVGQLPWSGPDVQRFRSQWNSDHRPAMNASAGLLDQIGASLRRDAQEQLTTSA
jgi:uncharacterized protein YukE